MKTRHAPALPPHAILPNKEQRGSPTFVRVLAAVVIFGLFFFSKHINTMPSTDTNSSRYTETIFIPYINKFSAKNVPKVKTTIEGVDIDMPVDTGSTGLLIGAPRLPNVDPSEGVPAHHFFTSSKIFYVGRLVDLSVRFYSGDNSYAIAKVPVFIVDKSWTCPWYNTRTDGFDCPIGPNGETATRRDTSQITYMGVGFGRNEPRDGMPFATPSVNPFLNLESINGRTLSPEKLRAGYVISTEGIHIGLTQHNTRNFAFINLEPGLTYDEDLRDWSMVKMCFQINDGERHCGPVLIDTGIPQMYIRAEEGARIPSITIRNPNRKSMTKMVRRVKPGTTISIDSLPSERSIIDFSFTVGEGSSIEPSYVFPVRPASPPFINTGRNFFFGYSIVFDAIGGRFGFRPFMYHVEWPQRSTVSLLRCAQVSWSGIMPGSDGE
ncbi:hypothetical protein P153DRAFT_292926 [Dothidotthia symphoricarpi CBS 119687]|uniref:Acid protease n=1 Tax=Dothidotthia symphoricarpi CBS 119687 TaxID=1392245 RepID=A0A6A6ABL5_9PLEO|nr:uncharacterized protein P153DRAFT_292926 [Dothidotthia symphoricarpi CBS 119687]KAF2128404.1 hypothetical protein P153DRAFT_292926 [Dothidotthia symphoricarpi CBS 119687]